MSNSLDKPEGIDQTLTSSRADPDSLTSTTDPAPNATLCDFKSSFLAIACEAINCAACVILGRSSATKEAARKSSSMAGMEVCLPQRVDCR